MKCHRVQSRNDRIRAVVFDFDGTLAVLNIDFSVMKEQVFDLMRRLGIDGDRITEKYLLEIIDEVCQRLGEKDPARVGQFYEGAHDILHAIEMKAAEEGRLLPGTLHALQRLRNLGMKIGIVTRNCEEAVRKVFPRIDEFCEVFISRDSTRKVKPHPDHLTSVMRSLQVSGGEAVMVGDHPLDIEAGRRVGMKTIGVLTGRTRKEEFEQAKADYILKEAAEVCRLVEEWDAGTSSS
jgi:phosphoglycolate phosphatase